LSFFSFFFSTENRTTASGDDDDDDIHNLFLPSLLLHASPRAAAAWPRSRPSPPPGWCSSRGAATPRRASPARWRRPAGAAASAARAGPAVAAVAAAAVAAEAGSIPVAAGRLPWSLKEARASERARARERRREKKKSEEKMKGKNPMSFRLTISLARSFENDGPRRALCGARRRRADALRRPLDPDGVVPARGAGGGSRESYGGGGETGS